MSSHCVASSILGPDRGMSVQGNLPICLPYRWNTFVTTLALPWLLGWFLHKMVNNSKQHGALPGAQSSTGLCNYNLIGTVLLLGFVCLFVCCFAFPLQIDPLPMPTQLVWPPERWELSHQFQQAVQFWSTVHSVAGFGGWPVCNLLNAICWMHLHNAIRVI